MKYTRYIPRVSTSFYKFLPYFKKKFIEIRFAKYYRNLLLSEDGATIIVALVLLTTIGFISFSVSTVLLRGIRISRILQNTELALSGANSGTEVSLYRFQRSAGGISVSNQNMDSSGASFTVIPDLTDDTFNFSVASPNQAIISLYNPEDINAADPGYRSVVINNTSGSPIRVDVISWDNAGAVICNFSSIPSPQTGICDVQAGKYQVIVEVNGGGSSTGTVRGWSGSGGTGTLIGIPSANPIIDVIGKMTDVQRRIRVDLISS